MAHGDAREGKWRGNWWMECVASTLHNTSEHGLSSITTADAHTSAASSRLNWRPRQYKWTRPVRRKTKCGFCACAIIQIVHLFSKFVSVLDQMLSLPQIPCRTACCSYSRPNTAKYPPHSRLAKFLTVPPCAINIKIQTTQNNDSLFLLVCILKPATSRCPFFWISQALSSLQPTLYLISTSSIANTYTNGLNIFCCNLSPSGCSVFPIVIIFHC